MVGGGALDSAPPLESVKSMVTRCLQAQTGAEPLPPPWKDNNFRPPSTNPCIHTTQDYNFESLIQILMNL